MGTITPLPPSQLIWGFDLNTVVTFDDAYWLSQPLPVQALQKQDPTQSARYALAMTLASQGYFIDNAIMIWGWDPYMTMYQRQIDGYTTYPDALGAQSRKVSLNVADYPPIAPPTQPTESLVGAIIGFGPYYFTTSSATPANTPAGTQTLQDGHTYTAIYIQQQMLNGQTQTILRWQLVS